MKRFRFHIASLLGVILFVAVGIAGLKEATESWDSGLFCLTLVFLSVSIAWLISAKQQYHQRLRVFCGGLDAYS